VKTEPEATSLSGTTGLDVQAFIDKHAITPFQLMILALCGLVVFLDGFNTQVIGYLAPVIARNWSLPKSALGWIFSSGLAGLMAGFLLLAPLADRFGRKPVMVACTVLFGLFTLLTTWARTSEVLIVCRFLTGVGLGGALPNAFALTGEYCPRRWRATLVVVMSCGLSIGSIVAGLLSAALLSSLGWRGVLWLGGLTPLVIAAALQLFLPESMNFLALRNAGQAAIARTLRRIDPKVALSEATRFYSSEPEARGVPVVQLFADGRLIGTILLWVLFFVNLLDLYFIQNWLPTIFADGGMPVKQAIQITTLAMAGGVVAAIVTGPMMDRLGPYVILTGLFLGGAVSVAAIGLAPMSFLAGVMATTFCAGFFVAGAQKSANALAVVFYPTAIRSSGVGWALGVGRLGSIIGPATAGVLITLGWSHPALFLAAAAPLLAGAAAAFAMEMIYGKRRRARAAAQAAEAPVV
jgi:AAHS family 4-hydroxybenzoate transporter-like MFS transporter